jgi:hypothetical protein
LLKLTLEYLPHGDESKAEVIGFARVCNLRKHEQGSKLGSFHGYFETDKPEHTYSDGFIEDYPRFEGSPWDLVATLLQISGRGHPDHG